MYNKSPGQVSWSRKEIVDFEELYGGKPWEITEIPERQLVDIEELLSLAPCAQVVWGIHVIGNIDSSLISLLGRFSNLIELQLGTDSCDIPAFVELTKLTRLSLEECKNVTDDCLKPLPASITQLDLSRTPVTDIGLLYAIECCPKLTTLNICETNVTEGSLFCLPLSLTELNLGNTSISNISPKHLPVLEQLRELALWGCKNIIDKDVESIAERCTNLTVLDLSNTQVNGDSLKIVAQRCHGLVRIHAAFCLQLTDHGIQHLAEHCSGLTVLDLREVKVTDRGIKFLAEHCPTLREIFLDECTNLTDSSIQSLCEYCPKLTWLFINGSQVGDEGLGKIVEHCHVLEILALRGTQIAHKGLVGLVNLRKLQTLYLVDGTRLDGEKLINFLSSLSNETHSTEESILY